MRGMRRPAAPRGRVCASVGLSEVQGGGPADADDGVAVVSGRQSQVGASALSVVRLGFVLGGLVVAVESAVATHHVAVTRGVRADNLLAWLTPVGIEGLAMACVAAHVYRRAVGQRSGLPLTGAALFGALAVWINVAAVAGSSLLAYAMAASAPIGLMLIVHVYPWTASGTDQSDAASTVADRPTVDSGRSAGQVPVTLPVAASDDRPDHPGDRGVAGHAPVALHAVRSEVDRNGDRAGQLVTDPVATTPMPAGPERDAVVDEMLADNPAVKDWEVAEALGGLSERTGRRLLEKARARAERSA